VQVAEEDELSAARPGRERIGARRAPGALDRAVRPVAIGAAGRERDEQRGRPHASRRAAHYAGGPFSSTTLPSGSRTYMLGPMPSEP